METTAQSWALWASGEVFVKDVVPHIKPLQTQKKKKEETVTEKEVKETKKKLIMVQKTDSIVTVLDTLAKHNISSAPILSQEGVIGFIDMLDVIAFAMDKIDKSNLPSDADLSETLNSTTAEMVTNYSMRNEYQTVDPNAHVYVLIQMLSKLNVHRVAVTQALDAHKVEALITQTDLIRWLYEHKDKAQDLLRLTVQDLWPECKPVITVRQTESVYNAFEAICHNKVSGVAVVDSEERLVGNISASDLKYSGCVGSYSRNLHTLIKDLKGLCSIESFLRLKEGKQDTSVCPAIGEKNIFGEHLRKNPPEWHAVCVRKEHTLGYVMDTLIKTRNVNNNSFLHRVYVIDEKTKRPLRAISLSDIIAQFQVYLKH